MSFKSGQSGNPGHRWKPGQSGNPSGRPRAIVAVAELARQHTTEAIATLVDIMRDKTATASARVSAAQELLDRGHGRAPTELTIKTDLRDMTEEELVRAMCQGLDGEKLAAVLAILDGKEKPDPPAEIPAARRPLH